MFTNSAFMLYFKLWPLSRFLKVGMVQFVEKQLSWYLFHFLKLNWDKSQQYGLIVRKSLESKWQVGPTFCSHSWGFPEAFSAWALAWSYDIAFRLKTGHGDTFAVKLYYKRMSGLKHSANLTAWQHFKMWYLYYVTSYFWQTCLFIPNGKECRGIHEPPGTKAAGVEQFGDNVLGISICQT